MARRSATSPRGGRPRPISASPNIITAGTGGPRIVAQGIWKPVRLETWDTAQIATLTIAQDAVSLAEARVTANLIVPATHAADSAKSMVGICRKSI